jgi:hypothetical protein
MTGVKVEVYDGKHHAVDSKEIAFITAGKKAFIDAVQQGQPALLEPFVTVEVTVPQSQYMGDLTGDISTKRGRVQDTLMLPGDRCTVVAQAPLGSCRTTRPSSRASPHGAGSRDGLQPRRADPAATFSRKSSRRSRGTATTTDDLARVVDEPVELVRLGRGVHAGVAGVLDPLEQNSAKSVGARPRPRSLRRKSETTRSQGLRTNPNLKALS